MANNPIGSTGVNNVYDENLLYFLYVGTLSYYLLNNTKNYIKPGKLKKYKYQHEMKFG